MPKKERPRSQFDQVFDRIVLPASMFSARGLVTMFLLEVAKEAKKGGFFVIPKFGTFKWRKTKPRSIASPVTGERIQLSSTYRLAFFASKYQKTKAKVRPE